MKPPKIKTSPAARQRAIELRRQMTPAEKTLWDQLRNRQLGGLKFRRQCPIGLYIADFYCAQFKLVVEVDGGIHLAQAEADEQRTRRFTDYGYQVLRVRNEEILTDLERVLRRILAACSGGMETPLHACGEGQG